MAKTIPKSESKSNTKFDFSRIAKELKGKTSFSIDLRKTDKNPSIPKGGNSFNFGERMSLLKAFREYREFRNSTNFIPITRQSKESKRAYKERLSNTKREMGQSGNHFKGIWIDTPNFAKVSKKRTKNEKGKWTTEITTKIKGARGITVKEKYITIDPLEFAQNPRKALLAVKKKIGKADYIMPIHSGHRGVGSGLDDDSFDKFCLKMIRWSNAYSQDAKKANHWLTGFLAAKYDQNQITEIAQITPPKPIKQNKRGKRNSRGH